MTLKRLAAKITPKSAHLITLTVEESGTMIFKALKTGFIENKGQSRPIISQTSVRTKANVSTHLIKF